LVPIQARGFSRVLNFYVAERFMSGSVEVQIEGALARVTLSNPAKFNAMSRSMWGELRAIFEDIQNTSTLKCVVVQGAIAPAASGQGSHFCAGGDISQYPAFRFEESSLRYFHENEVWGGLNAVLDCDVPVVASIDGNCMGAGVEIACCCDMRVASHGARFGAPIAKLGFPMAPREAALVMRGVGELTAREMLLSAGVLTAETMLQRGFLNQVVSGDDLAETVRGVVERICLLAPGAARLNKQSFRALATVEYAQAASNLIANAYRYAPDAEHREGISAFLEKRPARF
jgi:enoyl-CoA hydratase/carnithine racemase